MVDELDESAYRWLFLCSRRIRWMNLHWGEHFGFGSEEHSMAFYFSGITAFDLIPQHSIAYQNHNTHAKKQKAENENHLALKPRQIHFLTAKRQVHFLSYKYISKPATTAL
jgi:hypothetical protein